MSNFINYLRDESESEHVAYAEFALSYKKDSESLYCFFEGYEDKRYYGIRIKNIVQKSYSDFYCRGKDGVFETFNLISSHKEYDLKKTLFFVDNDFSLNHFDKSIYCLPVYSIENLYTSKNAIQNIIKDEFNINETDADFNKILKLYENLQDQYHSALLFFNSWLSCQEDIREKNEIKVRLNIDNEVNDYFRRIVSNDLELINDFSDLNELDKIEVIFPEVPKVELAKLNAKIDIFKEVNQQAVFRGKFEIKFLVSFLCKLQLELCKKTSSIFTKKCKCSLRFEAATAISSLTQYADTPSCLIEYLRNFKLAA